MINKFIFVIKQNNKSMPIITRCYTRECDDKPFTVNVFCDDDWARVFNSAEEAMIHYAVRGILAFLVPLNSTTTAYWITSDEMKNFKYETNGIPID